VTELPSITVSPAVKPAQGTASRTLDAPNESAKAQASDDQFRQELTREIGLQNERSQTAPESRDSSVKSQAAKDEAGRGDSTDAASAINPSLAAMLTGAIAPPRTPLDAISKDQALAGPGRGPGAHQKWHGAANAGEDRGELLPAAIAAPAESAATGKFLPAAEDAAAPAGVPADRNAAQALIAAGSDAAASAPAERNAAETLIAPGSDPAAAVFAPIQVSGLNTVAMTASVAGRDRDAGEKPARVAGQQKRSAALQSVGSENEPLQTRPADDNRQTNPTTANAGAAAGISITARDALAPGAAPVATLDAAPTQHHTADAPLQAAMSSAAAAPTQAASTASATIAAQLGTHGWDRGLGEKVVWMAGRKLQVAEMQLNPPELGPLKISLTISNDQASAQFISQHAAVREAIEAAMPRLREMLAEGGITLGNTSVSAESFREQAQTPQESRSRAAFGAVEDDSGGTFRTTQLPRATRGLVDIFA
jgi:flagellar hook-length control protein FliK